MNGQKYGAFWRMWPAPRKAKLSVPVRRPTLCSSSDFTRKLSSVAQSRTESRNYSARRYVSKVYSGWLQPKRFENLYFSRRLKFKRNSKFKAKTKLPNWRPKVRRLLADMTCSQKGKAVCPSPKTDVRRKHDFYTEALFRGPKPHRASEIAPHGV